MAITADYYVDPISGSDSNAGTSTGAPFATFQKAADTATAGQTVALKASGTGNDESPSVTIDTDTNSGSGTGGGYIRFIGVNSSWEHDDTRYVISGTNLTAAALLNNTQSRLVFHSIEFNDSPAGYGPFTTGSGGGTSCYFYNCCFRNNGGDVDFDRFGECFLIRCGSYNNDGYGFHIGYYARGFILWCISIGNSSTGIRIAPNSGAQGVVIGCVSCANGGFGIENEYGTTLIYQNTCDDNSSGGLMLDDETCCIANRITNNDAYGIDVDSFPARGVAAFNFFSGNTSGAESTVQTKLLDNSGNDTNIYTGNVGYNSPGSPDYDYNLTTSATMRDVEITLTE